MDEAPTYPPPFLYEGDAPDIDWAALSTAVTLEFYGSIPTIQYYVAPPDVDPGDLIGIPAKAADCKDAAVMEVMLVSDHLAVAKVVASQDCHGCSLGHTDQHVFTTLDVQWKLPVARLRLLDHEGADAEGLWADHIRWEYIPQ